MRAAIRSRAAWIMSMLSIDGGIALCVLCLFVAKTEFKHVGEVGHDAIFDGAQRRLVAKQFFHRSNRLTFAGDYEVEVAEIGINVESKAVSRYPARDMNAN